MQTIKHTKWKDWNTKETWQAQLCQWVLVKCQSHRHQLGPCPRSFPSIGPAFSFLFGSLRSQNLMIRALPGLRQSPVVADVSVPREHVGQKPDVGKIRFHLKKFTFVRCQLLLMSHPGGSGWGVAPCWSQTWLGWTSESPPPCWMSATEDAFYEDYMTLKIEYLVCWVFCSMQRDVMPCTDQISVVTSLKKEVRLCSIHLFEEDWFRFLSKALK